MELSVAEGSISDAVHSLTCGRHHEWIDLSTEAFINLRSYEQLIASLVPLYDHGLLRF